MNTSGQGQDEREWAAQERARRQPPGGAAQSPGAPDRGRAFSGERFGTAGSSAGCGDAAYRRIDEALRHPPPVDLPPDFAVRVARIAAQRAADVAETGAQAGPAARPAEFERVLVGTLACVLGLCALVAGLVYGPRMVTPVQAAVGAEGLQWTALLAGCLALSWSFEWLRRRTGDGGGLRPA